MPAGEGFTSLYQLRYLYAGIETLALIELAHQSQRGRPLISSLPYTGFLPRINFTEDVMRRYPGFKPRNSVNRAFLPSRIPQWQPG